jgi:hypothetical protein
MRSGVKLGEIEHEHEVLLKKRIEIPAMSITFRNLSHEVNLLISMCTSSRALAADRAHSAPSCREQTTLRRC